MNRFELLGFLLHVLFGALEKLNFGLLNVWVPQICFLLHFIKVIRHKAWCRPNYEAVWFLLVRWRKNGREMKLDWIRSSLRNRACYFLYSLKNTANKWAFVGYKLRALYGVCSSKGRIICHTWLHDKMSICGTLLGNHTLAGANISDPIFKHHCGLQKHRCF